MESDGGGVGGSSQKLKSKKEGSYNYFYADRKDLSSISKRFSPTDAYDVYIFETSLQAKINS